MIVLFLITKCDIYQTILFLEHFQDAGICPIRVTRGYLGNVHVKGLCIRETRGSGELDGGRTNTGGHEDFTQLQAPGGKTLRAACLTMIDRRLQWC